MIKGSQTCEISKLSKINGIGNKSKSIEIVKISYTNEVSKIVSQVR